MTVVRYGAINARLVTRARTFGQDMVRWYANEGRDSPSRACSGVWGAESDPVRQGQGKAGECSVAQYYGLDPLRAVKWTIGTADDGADITLPRGARLDVKTTESWKKYFIWPKSINHLYQQKKFDFLVGVSIDEHDWRWCFIDGYLTKQQFLERRKIADGVVGKGLAPDTWFVFKTELQDALELERLL